MPGDVLIKTRTKFAEERSVPVLHRASLSVGVLPTAHKAAVKKGLTGVGRSIYAPYVSNGLILI